MRPFEPPSNATAWRVRRVQRGWAGFDVVTVYHPHVRAWVPLVLHLQATPDDLARALDDSGLYRLDPIDRAGRVLATTAGYVHIEDPRNTYATDPNHRRYPSVTFRACTLR